MLLGDSEWLACPSASLRPFLYLCVCVQYTALKLGTGLKVNSKGSRPRGKSLNQQKKKKDRPSKPHQEIWAEIEHGGVYCAAEGPAAKLHNRVAGVTDKTMAVHLLAKRKEKVPIWRYLGFKPNANREHHNVNEVKGVGYLTEKLKVLSAGLHLTALSCTISPLFKLLPTI